MGAIINFFGFDNLENNFNTFILFISKAVKPE